MVILLLSFTLTTVSCNTYTIEFSPTLFIENLLYYPVSFKILSQSGRTLAEQSLEPAEEAATYAIQNFQPILISLTLAGKTT